MWVVVAAAVLLAAGLVVVAVRRTYVVTTVRGISMAPTLHPGDRLLVRRRPARRVRTGDVVVFRDGFQVRPDAGWVVKRVAAVPGEALPAGQVPERIAGDRVVPAGQLVVAGDNPAASFDSRQFGYLPGEWLLGTVVRALSTHRPL
jgi:signal peptidase I